jgi:ankyrin repeat protein
MTALDIALCKAARDGHAPRLRALIAQGADPKSAPFEEGGATALMHAAKWGRMDCVSALLLMSDPGKSDPLKATALHFAAEGGHAGCVQALLEADPSLALLADYQGLTPLMRAASGRHADCAELLIPHSDAQAVDRQGKSALDRAWAAKALDITALIERAVLARAVGAALEADSGRVATRPQSRRL